MSNAYAWMTDEEREAKAKEKGMSVKEMIQEADEWHELYQDYDD